MAFPAAARVGGLALVVRTAYLLLMLLADLLLEDYDTSAEYSSRICSLDRANSFSRGASAWQQLIVWDSVFFMDLSCHGYRYEQQYAFFPLLPGWCRDLPVWLRSVVR